MKKLALLIIPLFVFLFASNTFAYTTNQEIFPTNNGNLVINVTWASIPQDVKDQCAGYGGGSYNPKFGIYNETTASNFFASNSIAPTDIDKDIILTLPAGNYPNGLTWTCGENFSAYQLFNEGFTVIEEVTPVVTGSVMPAGTALQTLGGAIITTTVDTSTNVFQNFWPYFLIISILISLAFLAKRFIRMGRR